MALGPERTSAGLIVIASSNDAPNLPSNDTVEIGTGTTFRNAISGAIGYTTHRARCEDLHNLVHRYVGGNMRRMTSPNDPVFFLHHAAIDRMWSIWQKKVAPGTSLYVRLVSDRLVVLEEMERIGRAFDVPLLANMLGGGRTPILPPAELERLGFRIVIYGISLLLRIAATMERALEDLKGGRIPPPDTPMSFDHYKDIVEFGKWADIEHRYGR